MQAPVQVDWDSRSILSDNDNGLPAHPIPAMQEAFEESIKEAEFISNETTHAPTAKDRRRRLLEADSYDTTWTARWQQPPGARCHPIVKLMSQIVFGLHLLHKQQAVSETEVIKILQTHVDDIDKFLEKTTQDFNLALEDIEERMTCLKLPMSHQDVFERMLDDRRFRRQLTEGNEKIEKIITRTAKAMNATLRDVRKAVNTIEQLTEYLDKAKGDWPKAPSKAADVYFAMRGNEAGWTLCLRDLQSIGNKLGLALVRLGTVVGDMNKLIAGVSRRARTNVTTPSSKESSKLKESKSLAAKIKDKPLPKEPDAMTLAVKVMTPPPIPSSPLAPVLLNEVKPEPTRSKAIPLRTQSSRRPRSLSMTDHDKLLARSKTVTDTRRPNDRLIGARRNKSVRHDGSVEETISRGRAALTTPDLPINDISDTLSQSLPSDVSKLLVPAPLRIRPKRSESQTRGLCRSCSRHDRQDSQSTGLTFASSRSSSRTPSHKSRPSQSSLKDAAGLRFQSSVESLTKSGFVLQGRNFSQPSKVVGLGIPGVTAPQSLLKSQSQTQLPLPEPMYEEIIIQPPFGFLPPLAPLAPLMPLEPTSSFPIRNVTQDRPQGSLSNDPDLALMGNNTGKGRPDTKESMAEPAYVLASDVPTRPSTATRPQTAGRSASNLGLFPTTSQPGPSLGHKPSVSFQNPVTVEQPTKTANSPAPQRQSTWGRLFRKKAKDTTSLEATG